MWGKLKMDTHRPLTLVRSGSSNGFQGNNICCCIVSLAKVIIILEFKYVYIYITYDKKTLNKWAYIKKLYFATNMKLHKAKMREDST